VELDTAGDAFSPGSTGPPARSAALGIRAAVRELGMEVRLGLHAGGCGMLDGKIADIAAIGARISALAAAGEVLVAQMVKDLVAGSGIAFEDRGQVELKERAGAMTDVFASP
jgi:class 3 adenylate cyclase